MKKSIKNFYMISLFVIFSLFSSLYAYFPPTNLTAVTSGNDVTLSWETPGAWFSHVESNFTEAGFTFEGAELILAHRYSPYQLADFGVAGCLLTKVSFMSLNANNDFSLMIWTGSIPSGNAPADLVVEVPIGAGVIPEYRWFEVALDDPIEVPTDEDLWIGVKILATAGAAGFCTEPNWTITGYADMMCVDGVWGVHDAWGMPTNWMIKGFVIENNNDNPAAMTTVAGSKPLFPENPSRFTALDTTRNLQPSQAEAVATHIANTQTRSRNLLGYKVYRGNDLLTPEPINALSFTAEDLSSGFYTFKVAAIYDYNVFPETSLNVTVDAVTVFPYVETVTNYPPHGWERFRGQLSTNSTLTPETNNWSYIFNWNIGNFANQVNHENGVCFRMNFYSSSLNRWLVSPEIYLFQEIQPYSLSFDLALTPWNGTSQGVGGPTSVLAVLYSVLESGVWSAWSSDNMLGRWDNAGGEYSYNDIPSFGETYTLDIPQSLAGHRIKIAFYAQSNDMLDDVDLHLDNIRIFNENEYIYPPVSGLYATLIEEGHFKLHWIQNSASISNKVFRDGVQLPGVGEFYPTGDYNYIDSDPLPGAHTYSVVCLYMGYAESAPVSVEVDYVPCKDIVTEPNKYQLLGNYPNPFNPSTSIEFFVAESSQEPVVIDIYNIKGQKIKSLVNQLYPAGNHAVHWNGTDTAENDVSSGLYFYKMSVGEFSTVRKMVLMK